MRRMALILLCGLFLAATVTVMPVTPVSAATLSGSEVDESVGQTAVTAQVVAEPSDTPGSEPSDQEPSDKTPSEGQTDDIPSDHTAQPGAPGETVKTGDGSTWESLFFLLVISGMVIVAGKIRRLDLEENLEEK